MIKKFYLFLIFISIFSSIGCGGRNLYRKATFSDPLPLKRGYIYSAGDVLEEAGQEPVEFGGPIATLDTVFVANQTIGLQALERSTFRERWRLLIKNGISSALRFQENVLYFGANDGAIYAVQADFGKVIWRYETKAPVFAQPTVFSGRVYATAADDVVTCLDQTSGKWVWHYKRGGNFITTVHGNASPVVNEGLVYVGFSDGYFVALNSKDGNLVWEQKIHTGSKFTDIDATALIDGNVVYVPSYDGELYALEKTKGKVLWHIEGGGSKRVLLDDKHLYFASSKGQVIAIQKETGRIIWKFELDDGTPTQLVQYSNYLAFGSSRQYFYVIRKGDGSLAFRHNVGTRSGFYSAPFLLERDLYILSSYGNLYVFHWN